MESDNSYFNELAIASITIGALSFINLIGLEKSIVAIVFGILALKRIKADETQRGRRLAKAGIILAVVYTAFVLIMLPHFMAVAKKVIQAVQ